jgi:membrane-bound serine protease (ClpP class)
MTPLVLVITLLLVGLILLALELLVIPGFGVVGILGIAAILGSIWVSYARLNPRSAVLALVVGMVLAGLMIWLLPKTRTARSMVLEAQHTGTAADPSLKALEGQEGVALTTLRPSGAATIGERPVDVVTDGQYVEAGVRVRVIRVEGARVVVAPLS